MHIISFKNQNRIYYMLQNFWSGNRSFLGYVPDNKNRHPIVLGKSLQNLGTFPKLANASGRSRQSFACQCLYRVNNNKGTGKPLGGRNNSFCISFGQNVKIVANLTYSFGSHLDLLGRLFPGNIEDVSGLWDGGFVGWWVYFVCLLTYLPTFPLAH